MAKQVPARNGGTLTRPDKGETMNPNGRPKKLPALDVLIAEVMGEEKDGITAAMAILKKVRQQAASGNIKAAEMLLDRAYGKPKQMADITTNGESLNSDLLSKLPIEKKAEILRILNQNNDSK